MTHHDKARELVQRLKVVARCGTDSTMRHSAYAFMAQDPDGDYVTYSAYATLAEELAQVRDALDDLVSWFSGGPSSYGPWIIKAGEGGADAAVEAARAALSSTGEDG